MKSLASAVRNFHRGIIALVLLALVCPAVLGQQAATLVRMVTPPSWRGTNVLWNRDVQPHNKIDDTIDNSSNQVFDIVVNFRSCPTASDISTLEGFGTNQLQLKYLSSVALGNVAKSNITQIAAMTNVAFIEQQFGFSSSLTVSVPSICANAGSVSCAGNARALGYDGSGVNIAIIDSGVDTAHAAFAATPLVGAYNAITKTFGFNNQADDIGHGTHVASIALGQATVNEGEGVAPKAGLIVVKVLDPVLNVCGAVGAWGTQVDGLQTVYDQSQSGAWVVNVINMSFIQCDANGPVITDGTDAFSQLVNLAESMGIVVVVAAGNNGPSNVGLPSPAAATRAITVAASQTQDTTTRADDTIACFSSRGPRTSTGNALDDDKPEVAAPGTHLNCGGTGILAALANSGTPDNGATRKSGTSMASPHVAGLAALIMQAKPGINPASVKQLIIDTATAPDGTKQMNWQPDSGWGYVNGYAAVSTVALTDLTFPSYPPPVSWESPDISIMPDPAIINQPNIATVKIQNRGPNDAYNVRVQFGVYVFSASTPTFENIGTVNVPYIANGATMPVSINWTPQAAILGHNCLKVEIGYGADSDFSNNTAQRNINAQMSPVQFMLQNTATETAGTIHLIPTLGTNSNGGSNWTFIVEPTNVVLAADDCPVPVTAELFPGNGVPAGEKQELQIAAVVNTSLGPIDLGGVTITAVQTNTPTTNSFLPVYQVVQYGASPPQAVALANYLNIDTNNVSLSNGDVSFIDPTNFLAVPTVPVTNSTVISNLLAGTENFYPLIPIKFEQLDFGAFSNLTVLSSNAALSSSASAFANANLIPQLGIPVVGQATLNAYYTNDSSQVVSNSAGLDTEVNYQLRDAGGYPLIGPGAQVHVAYGPAGNVTRLIYGVPQLSAGSQVQVFSPGVATNRVASLLDPSGLLQPNITAQLVYFVPHFPWTNPCLTCPPPDMTNTVLPWYECSGTATVTNPITSEVSSLALMAVVIPATDDTNFVPAVNFSATTPGGTQVVASVSVSGGMPPYTYSWSGSFVGISTNVGSSVSYTPVARVPQPTLEVAFSSPQSVIISWPNPSTGFALESTTRLLPSGWTPVTNPPSSGGVLKSVTLDISLAQARYFRLRLTNNTVAQTETVLVTVTDANGVLRSASQSLIVAAVPTAGNRNGAGSGVNWGTENTLDPGICAGDTVDWRAGMQQPGGGLEQFLWRGALSWRLDFIEEPAGFDNLWVDNANMVLYAGHGNPTVITFSGGPGPTPTTLFYNQAPLAWGDQRENWMGFLSCSVLQFNWGNLNVWQRWGPDLDGLHILNGFRTTAWAGTGFPRVYANHLLGAGGPPVPVVQSWFSAALARENRPDGTGRAAAMGPIGPAGVWDFDDFYWGQGPVGPTIRSGQIRGWWYLSQP